jgi:DNA-directed RNA polymerase specialized sigma24 family protein
MNRIAQQFFVVLLLLFCCTQNANAQFEDLIDTLNKSNQTERRRILLGYIETNRKKIGDDMLLYFNTAEKYAIAVNDQQLLKDVAFQKYKKSRAHDHPVLIKIAELEKLVIEYHNKREWFYEAVCYHELSQIYFQREEYELAFQKATNALKVFQKIGYKNAPFIGKVLNEIALNHYFFQDYEEVIKLMYISIKLPAFTEGLDMQRYNNLAMAYLHLDKKDSAKYYLQKTYQLADKYGFNSWRAITSGSLGSIYYDENNYPKALQYFLAQVQSGEAQEETPIIKVSGYANLAKVYLKLDFISLAKQAIQKTEDSLGKSSIMFLGKTQQKEKITKIHLENKYQLALLSKDYAKAFIYSDSLSAISESIAEKYNTFQIELALNKLRIKDHQLEITVAESKKNRQSLGFVFLIILILAVLGLILFKVYRSRTKKKRQNERLLSQSRISALEKSYTSNELDYAKDQISQFIDKINQQNKLVQQFEEELIRVKKAHQQNSEIIEESLEHLKDIRILTEEDWSNFKFNFGKAYPELLYHLKKYTPALTVSEKRYLMLASLNLSNKEMANAIGVSDATIRVTRSRVRKKIEHLPEEITVETIKKALEQSVLKNKSISVN